MKSWIDALARTRAVISGGIRGLFRTGALHGREEKEKLEEALISADVPLWLIQQILSEPSVKQSSLPLRSVVEQTL
ncbi:MAG: hypothetical protein WCP86_10750, partial [bacterium]